MNEKLGRQVTERARKNQEGSKGPEEGQMQKLGNTLEAEKSRLAAALCCAGS